MLGDKGLNLEKAISMCKAAETAAQVRVNKRRQYSRSHRPLPTLERDDVVRLKGNTWSQKSTVTAPAGPRSFFVRTNNKTTSRRKRHHLLATKENPSPEVSSSDTDDELNDEDRSHTRSRRKKPAAPLNLGGPKDSREHLSG
ncbi:hypothetical protein HPB52_019639 [Rhipicephalus sanguineus]|uniref:Uncharacterized protein n=1 Tax=Rhipicephalus sanguineus TaxID=34632 RepID=A0A9D4PPF3_RHISA|nr:hypothetical protein HPB52_019639 [Rhipicephalus sanguineus]